VPTYLHLVSRGDANEVNNSMAKAQALSQLAALNDNFASTPFHFDLQFITNKVYDRWVTASNEDIEREMRSELRQGG
jgi:hypothetical protein